MYFRTSCTLASVSGIWVEGVFSIGFSSCSNRLYKMRYINSKEMALTNTASQSDSLGFHMERWYRVNSNGTEMEKVVYTHRTSCRSGHERLVGLVYIWWTKPQSSLVNISLPSLWIPVLATTYSLPLRSEYLFTPQQSVAQNLSTMWRSNNNIKCITRSLGKSWKSSV